MRALLAVLCLAFPASAEEGLESSLLAAMRQARVLRDRAERVRLPTPRSIFAELSRKAAERGGPVQPLQTIDLPRRERRRHGLPVVFLVLQRDTPRYEGEESYLRVVAEALDRQISTFDKLFGACGLTVSPQAAILVRSDLAPEACLLTGCRLSIALASAGAERLAEDASAFGAPVLLAPIIAEGVLGIMRGPHPITGGRATVALDLRLVINGDAGKALLSHELGHMMGMEHSVTPSDFMYSRAGGGLGGAPAPERCAALRAAAAAQGRGLR